MQSIIPPSNNDSAWFTYEEILAISTEKVKGFSDFLLKQNAITEEDHKDLEQCETFEQPYDLTAAKIRKVLDFFLVLNSLNDSSILSLKDCVKENPNPDIFERMVTHLTTEAELDQKIELVTRNLSEINKQLFNYTKEVDAFDQLLDSLLVIGQFHKANSMLKELAKKLSAKKEPTLIDELLPHRNSFVLINAPCWPPQIRKIAIKIDFAPIITTLKVDEISSHIMMLTTRACEKSTTYKKEIGDCLKLEAKKFKNEGSKKKAELIKSAFKYPSNPLRYNLEAEARHEQLRSQNHILSDSTKNQKVEKAPANFNQLSSQNHILTDSDKMNQVRKSTINPNQLLANTQISDFLWIINSLPGVEDRFFALCIMGHHLLPDVNIYETLKCAATLTNILERLRFIHDLFEDKQLNENDKLIQILNKTTLHKMVETAKMATDSLANNTPLIEILDAICCLPNEDFRSFVLYKMANQLFPNKNVFKWIDKCNKPESDLDRLAELLDFFESMQKDGDDYLTRLQLSETEKSSKKGISKILDMVNQLPEKERRMELFEQILFDEDHDTLLFINGTYDDLIERRQSILENFNK